MSFRSRGFGIYYGERRLADSDNSKTAADIARMLAERDEAVALLRRYAERNAIDEPRITRATIDFLSRLDGKE